MAIVQANSSNTFDYLSQNVSTPTYDIGDIKITSSDINPSLKYGGEWELIDKDLNFYHHVETISNDNGDFDVVIIGTGKSIRIRIRVLLKIALTDAAVTLLDLSSWLDNKIPTSDLSYSYFNSTSGCDGGNSILIYGFSNLGVLSSADTIPEDLNIGDVFYVDNTWTVNYEYLTDGMCNKFYWERKE